MNSSFISGHLRPISNEDLKYIVGGENEGGTGLPRPYENEGGTGQIHPFENEGGTGAK